MVTTSYMYNQLADSEPDFDVERTDFLNMVEVLGEFQK
jgi:hypothetical protein